MAGETVRIEAEPRKKGAGFDLVAKVVAQGGQVVQTNVLNPPRAGRKKAAKKGAAKGKGKRK